MRRDNHYLEDIRNAADQIAVFTSDTTLADFIGDAMKRSAVERQLIIAGEAAKRVSSAFKDGHPEVPWARLVQVRNFYVHGYDRLGPEEVWEELAG